ncbi:MAG: aminotransferase class III-fold pyridoxal phosphate-dependent enzyme [Tannerellaceae bacterium]|jgi:acetylornithine aminotransferase|nr:aminotransferase class III-fold pyridoxal phosphate-dependent enzyme [Tannerellaceae bacterium]
MKLFDVYPLFEIEIVKGQGAKVWDREGQEYLDFYGGHAVISIGHCHPHYVEAVTRQAQTLGFYSNSVINTLQHELADRLGKLSAYDNFSLFLINSGAEANENALKLASFHNGKRRVIAFRKSFHGRTSAAVRVTDNPAIVAPVNEGLSVVHLPFNDAQAVEKELLEGDVSSIIVEPIQGVAGIRMATDSFLRQLRELADRYDACLILDEIQAGYGRTGRFFAHQYAGICPDIITVAKGIANGFPMAAVLISPKFKPVYGMLGTTFGGNHLACAAALAVLDVFEEEQLLDNVNLVGNYLMQELSWLPHIREVRGKGLMIGIEMEEPVKELRRRLLFEQHVFTGVSGTHTIRLLPPLCLTLKEAEEFVRRLRNML